MGRIKLQGLGRATSGLVSSDSGLLRAAGAVVGGVAKGATTVAGAATSGVRDVADAGLTGVFSLGTGLRDFILKGTVVELAVAVVLGNAFTDLMAAITQDWITPLLGAIFRDVDEFSNLSFQLNGSQFNYGHFINAFLTFVFVVLALYFAIIVPLEKLQYAAFKHKAILRDCPRCLEEISMAATRCKWCCADIEVDDEMRRAIDMATTAMEDQEQRKGCFSRAFKRCLFRDTQAVVAAADDGALELKRVDDAEVLSNESATAALARNVTQQRLHSHAGGGAPRLSGAGSDATGSQGGGCEGSPRGGGGGRRRDSGGGGRERVASPLGSQDASSRAGTPPLFVSAAGSAAGPSDGSTAVNISELEGLHSVDRSDGALAAAAAASAAAAAAATASSAKKG